MWLIDGIVFSGIGAALSGLFCIMSDAMTSFAEQCIFVILLGIVQGKKSVHHMELNTNPIHDRFGKLHYHLC